MMMIVYSHWCTIRYNLLVNTDTSQSVLGCSVPQPHLSSLLLLDDRKYLYLYLFATRSQLQKFTKNAGRNGEKA